jgi:hypothetical protein
MRILIAWLLLALLSTYWIGGQLLHHVTESHNIELRMEMDAREAAISSQLKEQTGIDREIRILDDSSFDFTSLGYSGTFLFNGGSEDNSYYYVIESNPVKYLQVEFSKENHTPINDLEKTIVFDQLFPKFLWQASTENAFNLTNESISANFSYSANFPNPWETITTPPPRLG